MDLDYIKCITITRDIKIIIQTIKKVVKREGILMGNEVKMLPLNKEREEKKIYEK